MAGHAGGNLERGSSSCEKEGTPLREAACGDTSIWGFRRSCGGSLWITLKCFHMETEVALVTMYSYLVIIVSNRGAGGVNGLSFV